MTHKRLIINSFGALEETVVNSSTYDPSTATRLIADGIIYRAWLETSGDGYFAQAYSLENSNLIGTNVSEIGQIPTDLTSITYA